MQKAFIVHDLIDGKSRAIGSDRFVSAYVDDDGRNLICYEEACIDTKSNELTIEDCVIEIQENPVEVATLLNDLSK